MATRAELATYLQNPNVRTFLDVISKAEGTDTHGYATAFGGGQLESLADHPRRLYDFTQTDGKANKTSAAGKYQFLQRTWDDVAGNLGLQDFGPESQDLAAVELLRRAGALESAARGDFQAAAQLSGATWASLPSSPYAQPKRSQGFIEQAVNSLLPAAQAAGAPTMAQQQPASYPKWADVAGKPAYQSLSPEQKAAAQQQYFDQVIAPRVPPGAIDIAKQQFFGQFRLPEDMGGPEPEPGFWESVGEGLMDAGRQVGLTGRYALEGLGQAAGVVTEPLRQGLNVGLRAIGAPEAASTAQVGSSLADTLGLPTPQTADERVVGDIARTMAGAGGLAGGANLAARGATGITQGALNMLGANPGTQVAGAAGAGAAGGSVREAGGGELEQLAAALLGGVAAPMAASGVASSASGIARRAAAYSPSQVEQRVRAALAEGGVDYSALPARVQNSLSNRAREALRTGDLDPAAMARLADFEMVPGATPTRGMLSQDPQQVTREMNLAKTQAAAPTFGGDSLAQVQARNNQSLVDALNGMGAAGADDAAAAGARIARTLQATDEPRRAAINAAYREVRDEAGRYAPMDTAAFSRAANDALDEGQLGYVLPAQVRNWLNDISSGDIPLDVNVAQQSDRMLSGVARDLAAQGNAQGALAVNRVRNALENTPILSQSGEAAQSAYRQARSMAAERFRRMDEIPAIREALDDPNTDKFFQTFITGSGDRARSSYVQALAQELRETSPQTFQAAKSSIAAHLKDKALSGIPDDIGSAKFSPAAFAKALRSIGDEKLGAFFTPDELAQLHAVDRVGRLMVNQPAGSAVNNSNTAAAVAASVLDSLGGLGRGLKLFGIGDQVGAIQSGLAQRSAQQIAPALAAPGLNPQINRFLPASMGALLLSSPAVSQAQQ